MLPPEEEVEGAKCLGTMFSLGFLKLTLAAVARDATFLFRPPLLCVGLLSFGRKSFCLPDLGLLRISFGGVERLLVRPGLEGAVVLGCGGTRIWMRPIRFPNHLLVVGRVRGQIGTEPFLGRKSCRDGCRPFEGDRLLLNMEAGDLLPF